MFRESKDPDGNNWEKLSARTEAGRKKGKKNSSNKILMDTGALRNSLADANATGGVRDTTGNEVTLGTNLPYAAIQNFGGTIQIPMTQNGFGRGIIIPAHKVVIPARPFIGFGAKDDEQITEKIESHIKKVNS